MQYPIRKGVVTKKHAVAVACSSTFDHQLQSTFNIIRQAAILYIVCLPAAICIWPFCILALRKCMNLDTVGRREERHQTTVTVLQTKANLLRSSAVLAPPLRTAERTKERSLLCIGSHQKGPFLLLRVARFYARHVVHNGQT